MQEICSESKSNKEGKRWCRQINVLHCGLFFFGGGVKSDVPLICLHVFLGFTVAVFLFFVFSPCKGYREEDDGKRENMGIRGLLRVKGWRVVELFEDCGGLLRVVEGFEPVMGHVGVLRVVEGGIESVPGFLCPSLQGRGLLRMVWILSRV